MQHYTYLIIGGGVAGTTAAETIRQLDAEGTIGIISDEPCRLYSRVMLSKPAFFLERIPFDTVWLKPESWYTEKRVDLLCGRRASGLDANAKTLALEDGSTIGYEKLLIATGGTVRYWDVEGANKKGIHYLRTLEHGKGIIAGIKTAKKAVTIGGGVISFEMAELLKMAGLEVTMIIREAHYWSPVLDDASGKMIEDTLTKSGISIIPNAEVEKILGEESVTGVVLKDGRVIECDMVICGIGIVCMQDWFKQAGLAVNRGILANEYLETNLPDVWTAGDIAEYNDIILEEQVQLGNWVNAREQGVTAGQNMAGRHEPFHFVSFYTTQGLGINIAFVGDVCPKPDRTYIERGSPETGSYGRLIVVGDELVGATLMNRTQELTAIAALIKNNVKVAGKETELGDPNFDLKSLIPAPAPDPEPRTA